MSEVYRLVYASRNMLQGDDSAVAASVLQILQTSQRNNARCGVTGALLFNKGAFAQVLEGPRASVEATFERIQRDARHGDVTVLQCGPAAARCFANWSMAFVGHSRKGQAQWKALAVETALDLSRLDGDVVLSMLHELVLDEEGVSDEVSHVGTLQHDERVPPALDADRIRHELTRLHQQPGSDGAMDQIDLVGSSSEQPSATAVLKAALASERQRTTDLRGELDDARIALATSRDRIEAIATERDMWAERARLLAQALHDAAGEVLSERAGSTPSEPRNTGARTEAVRSAA